MVVDWKELFLYFFFFFYILLYRLKTERMILERNREEMYLLVSLGGFLSYAISCYRLGGYIRVLVE